MRRRFLSLPMPSQMLSASVMTMACEMRWPWCSEKLRARRPYLVLSREVCLAATRERFSCCFLTAAAAS